MLIRRTSTKSERSRLLLVLVIILAVLGGAALTALSPLALREMTHLSNIDWEQLSYVGQTYGAASALLSALALTGIALSLTLQAREIRIARNDSGRNHHFRLMEMAMTNPELLECWGSLKTIEWHHDLRQRLYLNLMISYWEMSYEVGDLSDDMVKELVQFDLFSTQLGIDFWAETRESRLAMANSSSKRSFWKIVDRGYSTTQTSRIPAKSDKSQPHHAQLFGGAARPLCLGLISGAILGGLATGLRVHNKEGLASTRKARPHS
jgi:hypothetical protein